jgi:ABC-type oligopeptide transport system ATPase subunit
VAHTSLKAGGLRKTYSLGGFFRRIRIHALDDVSFNVQSDAPVVISLIGESGSGKTTLAKALLRLVELNTGRLEVEGRPIVARGDTTVSPDELRHLVQLISQNPFEAFNAYRRVDSHLRDTAAHIGKAVRRSYAENLMEQALHSVGLRADDVVGKYPKSKHDYATSFLCITHDLATAYYLALDIFPY